MTICLKERTGIKEYDEMMEMLKPYLPKPPEAKPEIKEEWRKDNPYEIPIKPEDGKKFLFSSTSSSKILI